MLLATSVLGGEMNPSLCAGSSADEYFFVVNLFGELSD